MLKACWEDLAMTTHASPHHLSSRVSPDRPKEALLRGPGNQRTVGEALGALGVGGAFCAGSWSHSLVGLYVIDAQQHTLLMQLRACVPHGLRPLHPLGLSFPVYFD